MPDETELKKQIDGAVQKFREELDALRAKLDADIERIIAEAKQEKIDKLMASLDKSNG